MFINKEEEKWESFRDLTRIMENVPPMHPSEGFTTKVMARLSEEKETVKSFSLRRLLSTKLKLGFQPFITKKEFAFYFLLSGFFYLIMGLILMLGLPLPAGISPMGWFAIQPLVGLLFAAELTAIGVAVYKKGDSAVYVAQIGTVLYAALIILNGWVGTFYVHVPVAIFFAAIFSMTGLGIAVLLGLAIDRYHPETIFSEVRG